MGSETLKVTVGASDKSTAVTVTSHYKVYMNLFRHSDTIAALFIEDIIEKQTLSQGYVGKDEQEKSWN